jgi:hemolysin D
MNSRRLALTREEAEFLPASLEIIETPPSPVRIWFLRIICLLFVCGLAWSWFGRIDVVAVAQGKVQPVGKVKIVQPLEPGKVSAIHVVNGQHVAASEVLIELDATETTAERDALAANLAAALAEQARRATAITAARNKAFGNPPPIVWKGDIPERIRLREQAVLATDLGQLSATLNSLEGQRRQKLAELDRLASTVRAQKTLIALLQERVDMRESTARTGSGSRSAVIDALEALRGQETTLVTQTGQIAEVEAAIGSLEQDAVKAVETFIGENSQKIADSSRQSDELVQKLSQARARSERMVLRAPIGGRVQALNVTTIGQVIGSGESVLTIVPDAEGVEVEAYLRNEDIGFVKAGQDAMIKIDAFPFTRYGIVPAHVVQLAIDSLPDPDAAQMEAMPGRAARARSQSGAERVQSLVFPVTLSLDRMAIETETGTVPISPGMTVTVEIKTGRRRILGFLLSPLSGTLMNAAKER